MKINKFITFLVLLVFSTASANEIERVESAFPSDVHEYPLLFIYSPQSISDFSPFVLMFIKEQLEERKIKHRLIAESDLEDFSIMKYKYIVTPVSYLTKYENSGSAAVVYSEHVSYFFTNRQNDRQFLALSDVGPYITQKKYFNILKKVITYFEKGNVKLNKEEVEKKSKRKKVATNVGIIAMLVFAIAIGPVIAYLTG